MHIANPMHYLFKQKYNNKSYKNRIKIEGIKGVEAKTRSKIKPKFNPFVTCFSASLFESGAAAVGE